MSAKKTNADKPLLEKQKRFCEEYIVDLNGTQAAIRAGYSEKSAKQLASMLLTHANIQAYLGKLRAEQQERTKVTADRVVEELARIGFADMRHFINERGRVRSIQDLDTEQSPVISEIRTETRLVGEQLVEITKFKLHDKVQALNLLGRHLGMFEDNVNLKVPAEIKVTRQVLTGRIVDREFKPDNGAANDQGANNG